MLALILGMISSAFASFSTIRFFVESDNSRISLATTANPRPASPARAASMEAFSERRFVCPAIEEISSLLAL